MIQGVVDLLMESRRPVFIWGAGMRMYQHEALALARQLDMPVACTWGAIDLMRHDDPLMCGGFGTHGTRAANFAVQNADLIISIGSRLDTKATGEPRTFARGAKIVMVDIDDAELGKFDQLGRQIDLPLQLDAGKFISALAQQSSLVADRPQWVKTIHNWRARYDEPEVTWSGANPYQLMKEIGKWTTAEDTIVSDTGTALGYLMKSFPFKGERMIHAFNMTPMGYGLAASVGAAFATNSRVICVVGDGGLMMSLTELATIKRWNLNVKVILLNNHGHRMCVQTENQWFSGENASTTPESGLGFPDFRKTAKGFGFTLAETFSDAFTINGPSFTEVDIPTEAILIPQCRFGYPLEDGEPFLPRDEFRQQMIIRPL
jgi:acetolactate synthase-1/2/3 large subunit